MEFDMWKKKKKEWNVPSAEHYLWKETYLVLEEHLKWSKMTHKQMLEVHIQFWKLFSWTCVNDLIDKSSKMQLILLIEVHFVPALHWMIWTNKGGYFSTDSCFGCVKWHKSQRSSSAALTPWFLYQLWDIPTFQQHSGNLNQQIRPSAFHPLCIVAQKRRAKGLGILINTFSYIIEATGGRFKCW